MVSATAAGTAEVTGGPVISAWSAVSPWGLGRSAFAAGVRSGRRAAGPFDREQWNTPYETACLVPDFDVRSVLGKKGTRSMDRATGLAVTAIGGLLQDGQDERMPGVGDGTGLALGTNTGSAQSIMDFTRDSLVGERPFFVDPARFPNTVMNCAAGESAIWHRLKGPNTTIAGGRATGLLALQYAVRLQRAGRAETVLCGAVEEFSSARAWLEWHSRKETDGSSEAAVLGEGAAVWLLEPDEAARAHGRPGLAEVAGLEFGFARDRAEIRPALADSIRRLLERTGTAPGQVWAVADSQLPGPGGAEERAALTEVLGAHRPRGVACAESIGDTFAASAAFQIAAVLALAESEEDTAGAPVLVTSVEADGAVGAALLRLR